jgi:hypothetical protein
MPRLDDGQSLDAQIAAASADKVIRERMSGARRARTAAELLATQPVVLPRMNASMCGIASNMAIQHSCFPSRAEVVGLHLSIAGSRPRSLNGHKSRYLPAIRQISKMALYLPANTLPLTSSMKILSIISRRGSGNHPRPLLDSCGFAHRHSILAQACAPGWKDSHQGESPVVISLPSIRLPQGLQAGREGGAALVVIDTPPHTEAAARAADIF